MSAGNEQKKILIVDDSREVRRLVRTTLDLENYKVIEASSGSKAIELARKHKPDLIIMDVIMPGSFDGIEATRRIKSDPETASSHVIILTGSEQDRRQEGIEAGAADFFVKPFSPLDLIDKVDKILGAGPEAR